MQLRPCRHAPRVVPGGFSLIELMIAVAVLAVVVAIALPSYQGAVRKSRRAEAASALTAAMQAQERWRANNASYCTLLTALPTDVPPGLGQPSNTSNGYYTLSMDAGTVSDTGYTIVASAQAGKSQADDGACARLRVRMAAGNIFYGSATSAGAWVEGNTNSCWAR